MKKRLQIDKLNICDSYQRTVRPARVRAIVNDFDEDAVGSICVGMRKDGSFWVVDGQQRLNALKQLGKASVLCDVFQSSGPAHEARIFRHKNKDRTGVSPLTIFRALLTEGDKMAVSIQANAEANGLKIGDKKSWPYIKGVSSLIGAYEKGGIELVGKVLGVLVDAWCGEDAALHSSIISGVAEFLSEFPESDVHRLVTVLEKRSPSAIGRAADSYTMFSRTRSKAVCNAIVEIYNKGLRTNRLELVK